jgi:hypothetical protein
VQVQLQPVAQTPAADSEQQHSEAYLDKSCPLMVLYKDMSTSGLPEAPLPADEQQRFTQLCNYNILDTVSASRASTDSQTFDRKLEKSRMLHASSAVSRQPEAVAPCLFSLPRAVLQRRRVNRVRCLKLCWCLFLCMAYTQASMRSNFAATSDTWPRSLSCGPACPLQEPEEAYDRIVALCKTLFNVSAAFQEQAQDDRHFRALWKQQSAAL